MGPVLGVESGVQHEIGKNQLEPGKHIVQFDFKYDGPGFGKGGTGVLYVNGKEVARKTMEHTTPIMFPEDETFDVGIQRMVTARIGKIPERAVIYICPNDEALAFSNLLFGGLRVGKLRPEIFTPEELEALRLSRNPIVVNALVTKPGSFGHNYFYSNPAVSSDLVLVLRYHRLPGAEFGRPLGFSGRFWTIDDQYPTVDTAGWHEVSPTTAPPASR